MATIESPTPIDKIGEHASPTIVRKALASVLASRPFRTSKQCQDMLRYIVEHSLRHDPESLRERIVGVEVFGRSPDYDTSEDPVVRVRASDIRKRLAQYYQSTKPRDVAVRIEIPSGCYRAEFVVVHPPTTTENAPLPSTPRDLPIHGAQTTEDEGKPTPYRRRNHIPLSWFIGAASGITVTLVAVWIIAIAGKPASNVVDEFWAPVVQDPNPVLIYAGQNAVYRLSKSYLKFYRKTHQVVSQGPEFFVHFPAGAKIEASDLVPVTDTTNDAVTCARIVALLTRFRKPYELRYGSDIAIGDLMNSPTILIGAFNDRWTMKMTDHLRFVFKNGTQIIDTSGKTKGWTEAWSADGKMTDDYAVITRVLNQKTGRVFVTVAGIGGFGTQAAAEFLTNPKELAEVLHIAPPHWQEKNMQLVLHVSIMNQSVNSMNIVASQFW